MVNWVTFNDALLATLWQNQFKPNIVILLLLLCNIPDPLTCLECYRNVLLSGRVTNKLSISSRWFTSAVDIVLATELGLRQPVLKERKNNHVFLTILSLSQ